MEETRHDETTVEGRPAKREKHETAPNRSTQIEESQWKIEFQKEIEEVLKKIEDEQMKIEFQKQIEEMQKQIEEEQKKTEEEQKKTELVLQKEKEELRKAELQQKIEFQKKIEEEEKKTELLWQKEKEELRKSTAELEKKREELRKENEARQKYEDYRKRFPTMLEMVEAGLLRPPPNESNSSAHTKTGHRPARTEHKLDLPDELGRADKFWSYFTARPSFPSSSNSLGTTRLVVYSTLSTIIEALSEHLGFKIKDVLDIHACISLLDTVPDLSLVGISKMMIGSAVEIKKDPRTQAERDNIFGTGTEVQGEVYEQLYLVDTNNLGSGGVGLVTTAEDYMLVSLDSDISYDIEKIKMFFSEGKGKAHSTPNRMQTAIFKREHLPDTEQRNFKVSTPGVHDVVPVESTRWDKDEFGRVAAISSQKSANYSHYTSKVLSMSSQPKETLNLLAVFVILTLRNIMNYIENENDNNIMSMTEFSARYVSEPSEFSLTAVTLSRPIDFLCPTKSCEGEDFYAIRQLGFGSYGICCLAFNKNGCACVLKFMHKHVMRTTSDSDNVEQEAAMWERIYGEKYGIAARVLKVNHRVIIVMPYLQIPSTREDKLALCNGGKSSKLYRGLKDFCDAGYTHDDLYWHHVGEIPSSTSDSDNPCLLCDLGNISEHDMSEEEKEQWVNREFTALEKSLNREQEQ